MNGPLDPKIEIEWLLAGFAATLGTQRSVTYIQVALT